jgi:hypothetical protein
LKSDYIHVILSLSGNNAVSPDIAQNPGRRIIVRHFVTQKEQAKLSLKLNFACSFLVSFFLRRLPAVTPNALILFQEFG